MMLRRILMFALMCGVLASAVAADAGQELAGVYACSGKNPDGSSYDTIVQIVNQDGVFLLEWFDESEVIAVGLGIRSGDVLAVSYYSALPGVVAYRIEDGNRLVGEWTVAGAGGALFSETLTKMPSETLPAPGPTSGSRPPSPHNGERGRQRATPAPTPGAREL
jgi:hypothetical protein